MKVLKDKSQSLLLNYFGRENKYYLAVSILSFFDFNHPDEPLKEADLWPFVQSRLGEGVVLDAGMPKMSGEVLLSARCFPPRGEEAACPVRLRVGGIEKELIVFGRRRWNPDDIVETISRPETFTSMDLTWQNAFGGPDYPKNPLGKGSAPVETEWGEMVRYLPNIEYPRSLIGAGGDRPEPAGFLPLEVTWPQRAELLGTYDQKWLRERWPYFPEDMNWDFFNAAPRDQRLRDAFFQGRESFVLEGMHPTKPLIQSNLPGLVQRCFVLRTENHSQPKDKQKEVFLEIKTRPDTVWLFPHEEKGVIIHRGVVEVMDDEAADIKRIFMAREYLDQDRKSADDYYQEMEKRLSRTVKPDLAPLTKAREKIKSALARVADIDKEIKAATDKALGKAPIDKMTPADHSAAAEKLVTAGVRRLTRAENQLARVKTKYGHLAKIDLSPIRQAKTQLAQTQAKIKESAAQIEQAQAKIQNFKNEFKAGLQKNMKAQSFETPDVDLDAYFDPPSKNPWHDRGLEFVSRCKRNLMYNAETAGFLLDLGLKPKTIGRAWLGLNNEPSLENRAAWGLDDQREKEMTLPAGLVIPQFQGAVLRKILIWEDFLKSPYKPAPVEGSEEEALVLGEGELAAIVRVENDLEAWLLHQEAGGLCTVVAMPDPGSKLDKDAAADLAEAPQFLAAARVKSLEDPAKALESWKALHPGAEFLPLPEDRPLIEAKKAGLDLRQWVLMALKPGLAPEEEAEEPDGRMVPPVVLPDIQALVGKVREDIKKAMAPALDKAKADQKALISKMAGHVKEAGYDFDKLTAEAEPLPRGNPFGPQKVTEAMNQAREKLKHTQSLTPEVEKALAGYESRLVGVQNQAAKLYDEAQPKLKAAAEASPISEESRLKFKAMGVDMDDPGPLTREKVIEYHRDGRSLAGKNLEGVDLSELDLPGLDLRKANLQKTKFTKTNLKEADLTGAIAGEADFSEANLQGVKFKGGLLSKAKLKKARLDRADLTQALAGQADFSEASLKQAVLDKALLEEANLSSANLTEASIKKGYFLKTDVTAANFTGADLTKGIFLGSKAGKTDFTGINGQGVTFHGVSGGENTFKGANLNNSRVLEGAAFPQSDFSGVVFDKSFWREVDLLGGNFSGSTFNRAIFEKCQMSGANLAGVSARECNLNKTVLTGADMRKINLFRGSLRKTHLGRADLREANLYSVQFLRTYMNETRLEGANLQMTRLDGREDLLP